MFAIAAVQGGSLVPTSDQRGPASAPTGTNLGSAAPAGRTPSLGPLLSQLTSPGPSGLPALPGQDVSGPNPTPAAAVTSAPDQVDAWLPGRAPSQSTLPAPSQAAPRADSASAHASHRSTAAPSQAAAPAAPAAAPPAPSTGPSAAPSTGPSAAPSTGPSSAPSAGPANSGQPGSPAAGPGAGSAPAGDLVGGVLGGVTNVTRGLGF
ncbi:MAG TPA: hypothetical protein VGI84_04500 [Pseudonocardiaceae bacterium]|jgi:hypothetical protein